MTYKHTQFSYPMLFITIAVLIFFVSVHISTSLEPPSVDSGTNLAVTSIMMLIIAILVSFTSLQVTVDETYLQIKFSYGLYRRKFLLSKITSATSVKNHRYYGWGIRIWFWPKMWIYNVSGLDAVEILLKTGKRYRIGTDEPKNLEQAIGNGIR